MFLQLLCMLVIIPAVESSAQFTYPKGLPCKVYNGTILDCHDRQLSAIPSLLKNTDVATSADLDLNHMNGRKVTKLASIRKIDLSHNKIQSFTTDSFRGSSVQEIDLSYNDIRRISTDSYKLASVRKIDFSHNDIQIINTDSFIGLNNVEVINLSRQSKLTLQGKPFHSTPLLRKLYIVESLFTDPSTQYFNKLFENNIKLQLVDLSSNLLSSLPETLFVNLISLEYLDLKYSEGVSSLPAALFSSLCHLKYLNLGFNSIDFHVTTYFKYLTSLQHLDLKSNTIQDVPHLLFVNLTSLEYLDLSYNDIFHIADKAFETLTHLRYLDISFNKLTSTPCKAIEGLHGLKVLAMDFNRFDYVTCSIAKLTNVENVSVAFSASFDPISPTEYWDESKWTQIIGSLPASMTTLFMEIWPISVFQSVTPGSLHMSSLFSLEIEFNCGVLFDGASVSIKDDAFSMFPYLEDLMIHGLGCKKQEKKHFHLSHRSFRNLLHLKSLRIIDTGIESIPFEAIRSVADSLRYLDLSDNSINIIKLGSFDLNLEVLDLSNNPLFAFSGVLTGNVTVGYFNNLTERVFVIESVPLNFRFLYISPYITNTIHLIYLPDWPLCDSSPTLEEITFQRLRFSFSLSWGNCSQVKKPFLSDSEQIFPPMPQNYTDSFPKLNCLTVTRCQITSLSQFLLESSSLQHLNVSTNNIVTIGANDFSSLVNLKHMDLSHNRIQSLPADNFHHLQSLTYLNLAGNGLADLIALKNLNCLQTLIVSANVLTTLPGFLMKTPFNLQNIDFGENAFSCSCSINPLQHWIFTDTATYIDPQTNYLCKYPQSKNGLGITDFTLDCTVHLEYYIPPGFSALVLICILAATVYRYRWHIHYKYWVFFYQRRYQRYVDNDDDADIINHNVEDDIDAREAPIMRRRYHAYIAYHRESEEWVNDQLVANIEDGPEDFRLCLKERGDIPAGHYILNAICHGIYKSRKTIAVLSENFMDDGWCHYQLQIAQMRLVKDNEDVIILVQIGEIPEGKKTMLLRQILRNKEVLIWTEDPVGQELFWNKLKLELRKPARVDRRYEEV